MTIASRFVSGLIKSAYRLRGPIAHWTDRGIYRTVHRAAEDVLTRAWADKVVLTEGVKIDRGQVLRFQALPATIHANKISSVVVKHAHLPFQAPYDPEALSENPSIAFLNDWAGLEFLRQAYSEWNSSPLIFGGDRDAGVIVMEDVGRGVSLLEMLKASDPVRAEAALVQLGALLGRMHAVTMGRSMDYLELRHRLGPAPERQSPGDILRREIQRIFISLKKVGLRPQTGFESDVSEIADAMDQPGPFFAYVHGDACPDNYYLVGDRPCLLDFGDASYQHALLDAVFFRMAFPSCWCVGRIPDRIIRRVEAAYRKEIVPSCAQAGDDAIFGRARAYACGWWLITSGDWVFDPALRQDPVWGWATMRQRKLVRLEAFATAAEESRRLPALAETARLTCERLRDIWGDQVEAMPMFPAFAGLTVD